MRRRMRLEDLDIVKKPESKNADQLIASHLRRRKHFGKRSDDEIEALNQISISKWKRAVENGYIRKISDRVWFYDYTKF